MAAPAIGVRPRAVPAVTARIDWSHPLAQGLFCYRAGHGPTQVANATQTIGYGSAGAGPGLQGVTSSTHVAMPGFQTGPWSYFAFATPTSLASGFYLATMDESPGSNAAWERSLGVRGTGSRYRAYVFTGSQVIIDSTTAAVVGRSDTVVTTCSGSTFTLWVNGQRETSTSVPNAGFSSYTSPELVLGRGGSALDLGAHNDPMNAVLHAFGCWRRELSANDIAQLHADPFCLLRR